MRLSLGITGHRETNPTYRDNAPAIEATLKILFAAVGGAVEGAPKPRLHTLLALGTDLLAVEIALAMGWQVAAPLPFGKALNIAINAQPQTAEGARALLDGSDDCEEPARSNALRIAAAASRVTCFELAERDEQIRALFLASLQSPPDTDAAHAFGVAGSERAALAGQIMIEQVDLLIAVWDGRSPGPVGGTRHTINHALELGTSVLWIDAGNPGHWRLLDTPEDLANRWNITVLPNPQAVADMVAELLPCDETGTGRQLLDTPQPPVRSRKRFHAYRQIETIFVGGVRPVFKSLTQKYPDEEDVLSTLEAPLMQSAKALPETDRTLLEKITTEIVRRFARADATATYLSDAYRGGMVANLLLAALAVIGGIAYLPFVDSTFKWPFALFEFAVLTLILLIIAIGRKRDWHGRWFQTRRVAEYLRHAPFMVLLGVARSAGSWPHSEDSGWPEDYVRSILREIGLPNAVIDQQTLRTALKQWIGTHVSAQRAYHIAKAERLKHIDHNIERFSERIFLLAVIVIATYLVGEVAARFGLIPMELVHKSSKLFTFLGVALPTLGGAIAGIHYFADFGRFAAISESTANRLEGLERRIAALLAAPDEELDYGRVASIARAVDEIVVSEIEHWQDVFGGKHISVPV